MIVTERPRRQPTQGVGDYARQCEAAGCNHSARFEMVILGSHTSLCKACVESWREAYDNALYNWGETA